jgi:hypothetical protein
LIGPIEYQQQKQVQLDQASVHVTQTQNTTTGSITVVGSTSDFSASTSTIGARATCGAYQFTKVITGQVRKCTLQ